MRGRSQWAVRRAAAIAARPRPRLLVVVAIAASALLALPLGGDEGTDRAVLLYLPLLLATAVAPRRLPAPVVVPGAVASFLVGFGAGGALAPPVVARFLLVLVAGTALAQALAGALRPASGSRSASSPPGPPAVGLGLAALVDGTRALERIDVVEDAVVALERALVDLVGADAVTTFTSVSSGTGDPIAPDERVPAALAGVLGPARIRFVPDAGTTRPAARRRHDAPSRDDGPLRSDAPTLPDGILAGVRSALVVRLGAAAVPTGVAVVGWDHVVAAPNVEVRHAVELLAAEAAEAIERGARRRSLDEAPDTDPLTGLPGRRVVQAGIADLEPGDVVVVADLDGLGAFNAQHGTGAGDRTVRTLAACLIDSCRRDDWCGRLSDDELVVVFRGAGTSASTAVARVRDRWSQLTTGITFSAGVAVHEPGDRPADTLAHAQGALDLAKDRGRDRVERFPGATSGDPR